MISPWLYLLAAGLFEIVWASGLRSAFRGDHAVTAIVVAAMVASFSLLAAAMRSIPVGTAYAAWTGIGAIGTLVVGVVAFREPLAIARIVSALLIIGGIVGLKLSSGASA
jgi:quaternary ammonium compound-resistance protein SugE